MINLRSYIQIEVIKGERTYHISVPQGAPFVEAKEVLNEVIEGLVALENQQQAQQAQAESPEVKIEGNTDGL